jgi:hypothetical protein
MPVKNDCRARSKATSAHKDEDKLTTATVLISDDGLNGKRRSTLWFRIRPLSSVRNLAVTVTALMATGIHLPLKLDDEGTMHAH